MEAARFSSSHLNMPLLDGGIPAIIIYRILMSPHTKAELKPTQMFAGILQRERAEREREAPRLCLEWCPKGRGAQMCDLQSTCWIVGP